MIRRVCVLAGILGLFLQGSTGGHMLLVAHSLCIEHGELVHSDGAHGHADAAHTLTVVDGPAAHGTPDHSGDEEHEHCAQGIDRRGAMLAVAPPVVLATSVEAPHGFLVSDVFVVGTSPLLVAPKNSPPA